MTTESPVVDICYLEAWLETFISGYHSTASKQSLEKICIGINAIIQHDDFDQIADRCCSYHKMRNYWQRRYQLA